MPRPHRAASSAAPTAVPASSMSTPTPGWPPAISAATSAASTRPAASAGSTRRARRDSRATPRRPSHAGPVPHESRLDRDRLARLMAGEMARFAEEHPRSATLHARARGSLLEGVPMPWMVKWAGPFPLYVESAEGAHFQLRRRPRLRRLLPRRHRRHGRPRAGPDDRGRRAPDPPRHHPHAPDRRRGLGRRGADPAVRRRFVAVRPLGQRCQPLGPAPRTPHHRPVQGRRPRPLLPRVGRRGDRDAGARRRRRPGPRLGRSPGRRRPDDPRRRVQRRRRARARRWPTATSRPSCSSPP